MRISDWSSDVCSSDLQELLNSQVTLVTAERDAYVAGFAILAAIGQAEARNLNFDSSLLYNPMIHYRDVEDRIIDFREPGRPDPVATGTAQTPTHDPATDPPGPSPPET